MNATATGALQGRTAIVTGAASGIGEAICRRLAAAGARVVLADLDDGRPRALARELGDGHATWAGDLSDPVVARGLVDHALALSGRVDILVNNAGGGVIRAFLDHDEQSIAQTLSRNLLTAIHCCRAALPVMVEAGYGRIVCIGAESVRNGLDLHAMYNAAKGGVHGLTTGLAREFASAGITVNTVAPSIVDTEEVKGLWDPAAPEDMRRLARTAVSLIPLGRPVHPEEVAAAVAYLAGEEAAGVTGQVISVNGGSSML
jgi:2,3-dihydroxy-2,3-dihydro-p-cumate dehydrogenase